MSSNVTPVSLAGITDDSLIRFSYSLSLVACKSIDKYVNGNYTVFYHFYELPPNE
jgi:hypothetical protein